MPPLRAPDQYGVRELRYGGAPMSREQWLERHPASRCDVKTWTVTADDGTKLPHLACLTCWATGVERVPRDESAPAPEPTPTPTEAPSPEPTPSADDKTSSTKGPKR